MLAFQLKEQLPAFWKINSKLKKINTFYYFQKVIKTSTSTRLDNSVIYSWEKRRVLCKTCLILEQNFRLFLVRILNKTWSSSYKWFRVLNKTWPICKFLPSPSEDFIGCAVLKRWPGEPEAGNKFSNVCSRTNSLIAFFRILTDFYCILHMQRQVFFNSKVFTGKENFSKLK